MPTKEQLKLALAKVFPEIIFKSCSDYYWNKLNSKTNFDKVTPREWLQVCWECEETLTDDEAYEYMNQLNFTGPAMREWTITHATFPQRSTTLLKVKGIEI